MTPKELETAKKKEVEQTTHQCRTYTPSADIFERQGDIVLEVDMPGVAKDAIKVNLDSDLLTIEGLIECNRYDGLKPLHAEYNVGNYYRRFTISDEIDRDRISAIMNDGILTLTLPKTEKAKPREIAIR